MAPVAGLGPYDRLAACLVTGIRVAHALEPAESVCRGVVEPPSTATRPRTVSVLGA